LKQYLQRKRSNFKDMRGDPREILPSPKWMLGRDRETQRYVIRVRNGYLNQLRAIPKRGRARLDRIKDIRQRYLKEMRSIRKNLDNQAASTAAGYQSGDVAPAASAIGNEAVLFNADDEETWLAQVGADFDYWVACL
jgi:hypothetical protein